ncbi:hypothetical protein AB0D65_06320 [Streptomyces griseoloalbus]|uniref:Glycoside hydrolase family 2 domain-containing protein n=1 Tax=Streptomyces griseoloalbus TaxID=67303 RepID=A0ABV3E344_9ACTN
MRFTSFNSGWEFRPKVNRFLERGGRAPAHRSVTLPHDAMSADDTGLAFVDIVLTDRDRNLRCRADRPVTVEITGPGVLQGLGSGRPATKETFAGCTHTTYDGRALAVVRPTGTGPITVTVTADGCETASVTVHAAGTAA